MEMETILIAFMIFMAVMTLIIVLVAVFGNKNKNVNINMEMPERFNTVNEEVEFLDYVTQENLDDLAGELKTYIDEHNNNKHNMCCNNVSYNMCCGDIPCTSLDKEPFREKLEKLPQILQFYFEEVEDYVKDIDFVKQIEKDNYLEYQLGNIKLVKFMIIKGNIICEFHIINKDLKKYIIENKLVVKQTPTFVKLENRRMVQIAKDSVNIILKSIEEEKEEKRQLREELKKQNSNEE